MRPAVKQAPCALLQLTRATGIAAAAALARHQLALAHLLARAARVQMKAALKAQRAEADALRHELSRERAAHAATRVDAETHFGNACQFWHQVRLTWLDAAADCAISMVAACMLLPLSLRSPGWPC